MSIAEKLTTIAENQQRVYDAGYAQGQNDGGGGYDSGWNDGYQSGYSDGEDVGWNAGYSSGWDEGNASGYFIGLNEGIEEGKREQEDAFWDAIQQNGTRTSYNRAFCSETWNDDNFKPKYDIRPTANNGFYNCFNFSNIVDLKGVLERQGVTLDTSQCAGDFNQVFANAKTKRVPTIDASKATTIAQMFISCPIEYVEGLIVGPSTTYNYAFDNAGNLEHIIFGGTIGQNRLDMSGCHKLNKASIDSIVNALSDTTSGLSITLSKTAVDAISAAEGEDYGDYISSLKPNWTINLL